MITVTGKQTLKCWILFKFQKKITKKLIFQFVKWTPSKSTEFTKNNVNKPNLKKLGFVIPKIIIMKTECLQEFVDILKEENIIDEALCLGYDFTLDDITVGSIFLISPNFAFPNSTDDWTMRNALMNNGHWQINSTVNFYSDKFVVLKIQKKFTKKSKHAFLRVKNIRTNVDFDLIKNKYDEDEIHNFSTLELYFTHIE